MKYNEWRDELKNNLLSVSEAERRRVLDYYAEAYADRRDAGFTEREIIDDFGAPYDAAQRILSENPDPYPEIPERRREPERERGRYSTARYDTESEEKSYSRRRAPETESQTETSWVFVLLCVIFAVPIFFVILSMIIATVSICVVPFATLISAVAAIGAGIGEMFSDLAAGGAAAATGVMLLGVSVVLFPVCFGLVKLMWKLFKKLFDWLKSLFVKRRKTV